MYRYFTLMAIVLVTACQTQYEPLTLNAVEPRVLPDAMSNYYADTLAPILEESCSDCHLDDPLNTGFTLISPISDQTNFETLLVNSYSAAFTDSLTSPHPDVAEDDLAELQAFNAMAQTYWHWQGQLDHYQALAQTVFEQSIEDSVIQPACSICHRLEDDATFNPLQVLSFYGHTKPEHGALNSDIAFSHLIRIGNGEQLLQKALGEDHHGGGQVLVNHSPFSDALRTHADAVEQYRTLLNQPPF